MRKTKMTQDKLERLLREYDELSEREDLPQMRLSDLESIEKIAGNDYSRTAYVGYRMGFLAGLRYAQKNRTN
ncbi:MAG: hypothetical protein IKF39_02590 [Oscillospiraceae bacterium]|nr:hypothetical protein [Oscillospiraceae bacterium]